MQIIQNSGNALNNNNTMEIDEGITTIAPGRLSIQPNDISMLS